MATAPPSDCPEGFLLNSQVVTTHDPTSRLSVFHPSTGPMAWVPMDPSSTPPMVYVSYIHSAAPIPAVLSSEADLEAHASRDHGSAIGMPGGVIAQMMAYRPGMDCPMHRTLTLDYGVVLEGTLEVELDNGEKRVLRKGDVVVQRSTMHLIRNPSKEEWAKAFFVAVEAEKVNVGGVEMEQDVSGFGL